MLLGIEYKFFSKSVVEKMKERFFTSPNANLYRNAKPRPSDVRNDSTGGFLAFLMILT